MGNTCNIGIATDRTSYFSGSTLRGTVYLQVDRTGGIRATSLNVRLRGDEIATVHRSAEEDRDEYGHRNPHRPSTHDRHERSTESVLNLDFPIATFADGTVSPGRYEFPFELILPESLPASVYARRGKSEAEIRYEIEARLVGPGGLFGRIDAKSSDSRVVRILGAPRRSDDLTGIATPPETERINACCCSNRGIMTLQTEIDRGVLSPGETATVSFRCRNDSTVPVSKVRVELREKITWRARDRTEAKERVLCDQSEPGDAIPELRKLEHIPRRSWRNSNGYDTVLFADEQSKRSVSIVLPPDSRETYLGTLIEVRHLLTVTLETPRCATSPESCISVAIRPAPSDGTAAASPRRRPAPSPSAPPLPDDVIPQAEALPLPPDWSAVTADLVSIPTARAMVVGGSPPGPTDGPPTAGLSAPPASASGERKTLSEVESELSASFDQSELMERYTNDAALVPLFQNLTPDAYACLLLKVRYAKDQTRIARAVASVMDERFTCAHVAACAILLPSIVKMDVVRDVAPLASDLNENKDVIKRELTDMETIHFEAALR